MYPNTLRSLLKNTFSSVKKFERFSSIRTNKPIKGIFPPVVTPFIATKQEEIAWQHLESNLRQWEKIDFSGYVIHGSNGEYPFLMDCERLDVVKFVKKNISKDKMVIAGAGYESLKNSIKMCEEIAKHGVDYALVITPAYYKSHMTNEALLNYYTRLADNSPIPIIMYNMPANTGVDITAELCCELSHHPNIIGLKDSGGNIPKMAEIVQYVNASNQEFYVIAGSAGFLLDSLKVGATGGICALANVLGNEVVELYKLFQRNELQAAKVLQSNLVEPNKAVTRLHGVPGLKASLDANGYYGGPCRTPLLPLNEKNYEHVKRSFVDAGYNWSPN